jgi:hypothetical protein
VTDQSRRLPLWQRNLIGVVVTAAALAVLIAVDLWPPWTSYRDTVDPEHVVQPRQSVNLDGHRWAIADIRHLGPQAKPGAPPLPDGTVVTEVRLEGAKPPDTYLTGVLTDGQRHWRGDTYGAQPGELQWSFVVPADAVPTALDVTTLDGSILVRLQL